MSLRDRASDDVRRRAQDQFAKAKQRDDQVLRERNKLRAAQDEKIARLRALRLEKEAAERVAAEQAALAKAAKPARRRAKPAPEPTAPEPKAD